MTCLNKKALVTGAGGFIGSHLVEALVERGYQVRAFVHYNSFNRWGWLDHIQTGVKETLEIQTGDIIDPHGVRAAMKGVDVVFHLAALIGIPYSYRCPDIYVDTNVRGTLNVLQAARDLQVQKVVHTSTSEVYGTAQFVPITEGHPINPQSPYAATKAGADFLALTFHRSFGLPVSVVRPFNTYGPRQSARAVVPTIISQVLSGSHRVELGSLHPTRDLTYVNDTVQGFIQAAESEKSVGEVVNIGSNHEISVRDLAFMIATTAGVRVEISLATDRERPARSEVARLWASNTKAREVLRWCPTYTLEHGLRETLEWFRNPEHLRFYKPDLYNI